MAQTKQKKARFSALTECEHWAEAEAMVKGGKPATEVAEFLHSQGELLGTKVKSLARQIIRYKAKWLSESTLFDRFLVNVKLDEIDNLDLMTRVVALQQRRIERDYEMEQYMPKTMPSLTKDLVVFMEMIERREKLMQDRGLTPRAPQAHLHAFVGENPFEKLLDKLPSDQRVALREELQGDYAANNPLAIEAPFRNLEEDEDDNRNTQS